MTGFFAQLDNPTTLALLGALSGVGQAAGASRLPVTNGQVFGALGGGLLQGVQAANQSQLQQQQAAAAKTRTALDALKLKAAQERQDFGAPAFGALAPAAPAPVPASSLTPSPPLMPPLSLTNTLPVAAVVTDGGGASAPQPAPPARAAPTTGADASASDASGSGGAPPAPSSPDWAGKPAPSAVAIQTLKLMGDAGAADFDRKFGGGRAKLYLPPPAYAGALPPPVNVPGSSSPTTSSGVARAANPFDAPGMIQNFWRPMPAVPRSRSG